MISPSQNPDLSQVAWTVTRCNRLLRPLIVRVSELQKLKERKELLRNASSSLEPIAPVRSTSRSILKNDGAQKSADPDWVAGPSKKKAKKDYSTRPKNPSSDPAPAHEFSDSAFQLGELSIPTPYISKVAQPLAAPPTANKASNKTSISVEELHLSRSRTVGRPKLDQSLLEGDVRNKYTSRTNEEQSLAHNLAKCFLELIHVTNLPTHKNESPTPAAKQGARSLFSTCCRQVPAFITHEHAKQCEEADDESAHVNIAAQTYEALEGEFEIVTGRGWRELRQVVRAHAVSIVKTAIINGLIPRSTTREMIKQLRQPPPHLMVRYSPAEADVLLSALVLSESPYNQSTCTHRNHFFANSFNNVGLIWRLVDPASRRAWELRHFGSLLNSPYFPVEWTVSHRAIPLWKKVVSSLLDPVSFDASEAFNFLRRAVALSTGILLNPKESRKVFAELPAYFAQPRESCPKCPMPASGSFLARSTAQQPCPSLNQAIAKGQLTTALTNTISSLSSMLASFTVAAKMHPNNRPNANLQFISWTLKMLSLDALVYHSNRASKDVARPDVMTPQFAERRTAFILISTLVMQIAGHSDPDTVDVNMNEIVRCIESLNALEEKEDVANNSIIDSLPELIFTIAQGSGQISREDTFVSLEHVVRSFNDFVRTDSTLSSSTRYFLQRLALSTSIESAHRQRECFKYQGLVTEVEHIISDTKFVLPQTPRHRSAEFPEVARGFRWEEGICEWVAATPMVVKEEDDAPTARSKLTLSPATLRVMKTPASSSSSKDFSDNGGSSDIESSSSPQTSIETSKDELALSDLLLASSPLTSSAPFATEPSVKASTLKRAHSVEANLPEARKKTRVSHSSLCQGTQKSQHSISLSANSLASRGNFFKVARPVKQRPLKRTVSAPIFNHDVPSDDELGSDSPPNQQSSRVSTSKGPIGITRRAQRGGILRSVQATTTDASGRRAGTANHDPDEDDELSFA